MIVNLGVLIILSASFGFLLQLTPNVESAVDPKRGLKSFSLFFWCLSAGILGLYFRYFNESTLTLSIFLSNAGFTGAGIFLFQGFCQRKGIKSIFIHKHFLLGYIVVYFALITWFSLVQDSLPVRSTLVFLGFSFWFLNCVVITNQQFNNFNKGEVVSRWSLNFTLFGVAVLLPAMFFMVPDADVFYSQLLFIILILETFIFGGIYISILYDVVEAHYADSITDPLTSLYNRRFLYLESKLILASAERHNKPVSIVLCDVDHFKKVNDGYGHEAGDEAIKAFSQSLQQLLRAEDILIRFGGEEFVVLLPHADEYHAGLVAERMRVNTHHLNLVYKGIAIPLTASFGVVQVSDYADIDRALALADKAMYAAKQGGRDQVVLASSLAVDA